MKKPIFIIIFNILFCIIVIFVFEIGIRFYLNLQPNIALLRFMPATLRLSLISDPSKITQLQNVQDQLKRFIDDKDLGWFHPPNSKIKGKYPTTAQGFHTPDNPAQDENQLIVIGDSFLEGTRTENPLAWRLKELLGQKILNLSAGGWGPGNYLAAYNKFAFKRNAKTVVIFSFINDVEDANNFYEWEMSTKFTSYKDYVFNKRWYVFSVNQSRQWLDKHSVLYNLIKYLLWENNFISIDAPGQILNSRLASIKERKSKISEIDYTDLTYTEEKVCWEEQCIDLLLKLNGNRLFLLCKDLDLLENGFCYQMFDNYFYYIEKLNNTIKSAGKNMLLVWIPTRERIYFNLLPEKVKKQYSPEKNLPIGAEIIIKEFSKKLDIPFLDLTEPLMEAAKGAIKDKKQLYGPNGNLKDGHFNKYGNEIVAQIVSDYLKSKIFIKIKGCKENISASLLIFCNKNNKTESTFKTET